MRWSEPQQTRITVEVVPDRLHVRWYADGDAWHELLDSFKAWFPPRDRRFEPHLRCWSVPAHLHDYLLSWCIDNADPGCVDWGAEGATSGTGSGASGRARSAGGGAGGAGGAGHRSHDPLAAAYATLHLLPSAPGELVQAAYRIAARAAHPDHGGDTAAMVKINAAMDALRARSRREA